MMQVMMYAWPAYVAARRHDRGHGPVAALGFVGAFAARDAVFVQPFFLNAWRDVRQRRISMDLPVALGMVITFVVSSAGTFDPAGPLGHEVYYDSLTMFVFFLLTGRWLELRLRDRTAGALEALMNRLPDSVERRGPTVCSSVWRCGVLPSGTWFGCCPARAFRPMANCSKARPWSTRPCSPANRGPCATARARR
jgi:Cu2+-exporting ATPase